MAKIYEEINIYPDPSESLEVLWNKYATLIHSLSQDHLNNLYALLYHCAMLEGHIDAKNKKLPYNGKFFGSGRGVLYTIDDISKDTQIKLLKYIMVIHEQL